MKRIEWMLSVLLVLCVFVYGCSKGNTDVSDAETTDVNAVENTDVTENTDEEIQSEEDVHEAEVQEETVEVIETEETPETEIIPEEEPNTQLEEVPEVKAPAGNTYVHVSVESISLSIYDVTIAVGQRTMPIVTMYPRNASDKGEIWQSSDENVATVDNIGNITGKSEGVCTVTVTSKDNPEVFANVSVNVIKGEECTYIDGILIANKTYPLPQSFAPGWDAEASSQLHVMFAAAKQDGINLFVKSGYRSYIDQKIIYNGYVARDGKEMADTYSARPGHSEHQTGLAFDLNSTANSFADTPQAKWIAENSYKYGFIIRYPKGKEHITGYIYEPWHVRYLGVEKATEVFESGLCLEEFLGITSVYSY